MIIKCPECGHQVSDKAKTCPSCGIDIAGHIARCPECGSMVLTDQTTCPQCHHVLTDTELEVSGKVQDLNGKRQASKGGHGCIKGMLILFFLVLTALVGWGVYSYMQSEAQNEQECLERAISSDEPVLMQEYLKLYPRASQLHRDSIQARINALALTEQTWQRTAVSGSVQQIKDFIDANPHSKHRREALLLIDSLDWIAAVKSASLKGYQDYIHTYSHHGEHSDEAYRMIDSIQTALAAAEQARRDSLDASGAEH